MEAASNTGSGVSSLLSELLQVPFAKVPRFSRSVDAFDFESANYIALRVLDQVVDFETEQQKKAHGTRAESVGELLGA